MSSLSKEIITIIKAWPRSVQPSVRPSMEQAVLTNEASGFSGSSSSWCTLHQLFRLKSQCWKETRVLQLYSWINLHTRVVYLRHNTMNYTLGTYVVFPTSCYKFRQKQISWMFIKINTYITCLKSTNMSQTDKIRAMKGRQVILIHTELSVLPAALQPVGQWHGTMPQRWSVSTTKGRH